MRKEAETTMRLPGIEECSLNMTGAVAGLSSLLGYLALVLSAHGWKILHPNNTLGLEALWSWEKLMPGGQVVCAVLAIDCLGRCSAQVSRAGERELSPS